MIAKKVFENLNNVFKPKELNPNEKELWNTPKEYQLKDYVKHYFKGVFGVKFQQGRTHVERGYAAINNDVVDLMRAMSGNEFLSFSYRHSNIGTDGYYHKRLSDFIKSKAEKRGRTVHLSTWVDANIYSKGLKDIYGIVKSSHSGLGSIYDMVVADKELIKEILEKFPDLDYKHGSTREPMTADEMKQYLNV